MSPDTRRICALTIAGSDSGGGAGIQADLKTFHAHGLHGTSAITAITAQNTQTVRAVYQVPGKHIRSQIDAVFEDFRVGAVKIGMLGSAATVRTVAAAIEQHKPPWVVLDPVMIAASGARLLEPAAIKALTDCLIPLADLLTPNVPEAEVLLARQLADPEALDRAATELLALGVDAVLLKGGHNDCAGTEVVDRWRDHDGLQLFRNPRLPRNGHGTGCTLSSAIAAELARGSTPRQAAATGIAYVHRALRESYRAGRGKLDLLAH